jgi:hypothetical protein
MLKGSGDITPTYEQYVHRWVVIPEREGFHLKTRSVMKQLVEHIIITR